MKKVYIAAAKRTAIGKFLGSLTSVPATELAATVIRSIMEENKLEPASVDEVIVGNVLSAGLGQGVARQAAIRGGISESVPAYGINMICGSGMKSVMAGYTDIVSGQAELVLAGGTESMSRSGFVTGGEIRTGHKMGSLTSVDMMINDGLTDAFSGVHMGITAENIAEKYGISRKEQDGFSYESQQKAIRAVDSGRFRDEIVPVKIVSRKETIVFDTDEFPNRKTDPEKLAGLKPAFKKDGTVTAGNASGINDGASFVLLASQEALQRYNLKPLVEIVSVGQGGVDPQIMGMGPVPAIAVALKKSGMDLRDMDLVELNEAFAAQSLGVIKQLCEEHGIEEQWFDKRTNVNGGAIALGHPIGASGNRIIVTLVHEMLKTAATNGLASLCIGGGMGTAVVMRRL